MSEQLSQSPQSTARNRRGRAARCRHNARHRPNSRLLGGNVLIEVPPDARWERPPPERMDGCWIAAEGGGFQQAHSRTQRASPAGRRRCGARPRASQDPPFLIWNAVSPRFGTRSHPGSERDLPPARQPGGSESATTTLTGSACTTPSGCSTQGRGPALDSALSRRGARGGSKHAPHTVEVYEGGSDTA